MPLPKFLQRVTASPAAAREREAARADDEAGSVQAARTRARRRLIGAVVLLAVGVVAFPLLFETEPRPIPPDVAIDAPASRAPAAPSTPRRVTSVVPPPDAGTEATSSGAAPDAASVTASAPVAVAVAAAPPPVPASAPRTAALTAAAGVPRPQVGVVATPAGPAVAAGPSRASSAADSDDRFVVQVGAYTDPATLREARQKVERLGLKTYTQVIETDAGRRTRVRVGPFDSRADADEAARRLKAAGLPANILVL